MKPASSTLIPRRVAALSKGMLLLLFFLLNPTADVWAEQRPVIQVDFEFDGQLNDLLLSQQQRDMIKTNAIKKISRQAEERWGFLNWSVSPPASATTDIAKWKVTFAVEAFQLQGAAPATIGTLIHSGQFQSRQYSFKGNNEDRYTIYPIEKTITFSDPELLSEEINKFLETQLGALLEEPDVEKFLNLIPIADSVIADTDISRIVVPVKASELRTGVKSKLRVGFKQEDFNGALEMEQAQEVSVESPNKGYIVGWVTMLQHDEIQLPHPAWGFEQLSPVIGTWEEVNVYMLEYNGTLTSCALTEDGQPIDPFDCGEAQ